MVPSLFSLGFTGELRHWTLPSMQEQSMGLCLQLSMGYWVCTVVKGILNLLGVYSC